MKKLIPLLLVLLFLEWAVRMAWASFTISGNQISVASTTTTAPTPIPCGTSTPVTIIQAGSVLNGLCPNGNLNTFYVEICVHGGTAGTDTVFMVPAPVGSPAAAPSPEANSSPGYGQPYSSGGAGWTCSPLNFPTAGGGAILSSRWDGVCTTSLSIIPVTIGAVCP